jgi:predicted polyphosphate/ATP-dependent NAD kinase
MGGDEALTNAAGESVGRKIPVLGISVGAAETAKEGWNAKNAFARAANGNRSKQERIAAAEKCGSRNADWGSTV